VEKKRRIHRKTPTRQEAEEGRIKKAHEKYLRERAQVAKAAGSNGYVGNLVIRKEAA
jgi:hypothetical protein